MARSAVTSTPRVYLSTDSDLNDAGQKVLELVLSKHDPLSPNEIVSGLRSTTSETLLRTAILYLLDYDLIRLTDDRRLAKGAELASKSGENGMALAGAH